MGPYVAEKPNVIEAFIEHVVGVVDACVHETPSAVLHIPVVVAATITLALLYPTASEVVIRDVPETSRVYAGALVLIPTLLLLITMRATPEVSKANCELLIKCMPDDGSDTKEYEGPVGVPDPANRLLPLKVRFGCAIADVVLVPFAVRTRFAAGVVMAENPAPAGPVGPV
jgi:hypothetical protein